MESPSEESVQKQHQASQDAPPTKTLWLRVALYYAPGRAFQRQDTSRKPKQDLTAEQTTRPEGAARTHDLS
ncbi:uncharacterized protein BP5553_07595 [Venustampulla echinocandica]|uniref:Uncharacterized protein n=1 Tax=Venustampulla echinocandica TaxID=2656787 RepID=A0A370TGY7_9HELO|nr:uncharacterized protein BP5553_07595 [Venustampulla echinocandica]RDL34467.1 hypothetical protein BP5553_07595 [Venustampulla echinocandica]